MKGFFRSFPRPYSNSAECSWLISLDLSDISQTKHLDSPKARNKTCTIQQSLDLNQYLPSEYRFSALLKMLWNYFLSAQRTFDAHLRISSVGLGEYPLPSSVLRSNRHSIDVQNVSDHCPQKHHFPSLWTPNFLNNEQRMSAPIPLPLKNSHIKYRGTKHVNGIML